MALYKHQKAIDLKKERDFLYSLVEGQDNTPNMLFIKSNSKLLKVQTKDVYYVEALKDYVIVNTLNGRFTIHSTMKDIEAKLPAKEFVRVHRSFIVRIDKIISIEQPYLIIEHEKKPIPIGDSHKEELMSRLNLL